MARWKSNPTCREIVAAVRPNGRRNAVAWHFVDGLGRWRWNINESVKVASELKQIVVSSTVSRQCASRENSSRSRLPNALRRTDSSRNWTMTGAVGMITSRFKQSTSFGRNRRMSFAREFLRDPITRQIVN